MKKIFTVLIFSFYLLILTAQDVPNPGFEIWIDNGNYEEPEYWSTPNPFTSLAGVVTVQKSLDAASGTFSARLETKDVLGGLFQSPGLLTLGDFFVNIQTQEYSFSGGIPLTNFVTLVQGKYKYAGVEGDSASLFAFSFRHPEGEDPDTVAMGGAFLHDAAEWTDFSFPVFQISPDTPDTFNLQIMSAGTFDFITGSVLYVDDISITLATGIDETKEKSNLSIYPNPTTNRITFELFSKVINREINIYDVTGRLITRSAFTNKSVTFDLGEYPKGVYTYRLMSENKLLEAGSFVKQ
jgi:hypothetical protein